MSELAVLDLASYSTLDSSNDVICVGVVYRVIAEAFFNQTLCCQLGFKDRGYIFVNKVESKVDTVDPLERMLQKASGPNGLTAVNDVSDVFYRGRKPKKHQALPLPSKYLPTLSKSALGHTLPYTEWENKDLWSPVEFGNLRLALGDD
eukprot:scaffold7353_cov87-Cylindrotheca_fusiformis.AAC.6